MPELKLDLYGNDDKRWFLELALIRPVDGDTCPIATLARFKKRADFTPATRRAVVEAIRNALAVKPTRKREGRR